jgi:hypothetical protein
MLAKEAGILEPPPILSSTSLSQFPRHDVAFDDENDHRGIDHSRCIATVPGRPLGRSDAMAVTPEYRAAALSFLSHPS